MPDLATLNNNSLEALSLCLETMAFISLDPAETPLAVPPEPVLVQIDFSGPAFGTLELCTSAALGTLVAQAVTDEESPSITSFDALKELMNMVAGALLRNSELPHQFSISLPFLRSNLTDEEWGDFVASPGAAVALADGVPVAIRLSGLHS